MEFSWCVGTHEHVPMVLVGGVAGGKEDLQNLPAGRLLQNKQ